MDKTFQAMLADTPLVKNLENGKYMDILLDGRKSLEELFADIEPSIVRKELLNAQANPEKIPSGIKNIIAIKNLPEIMVGMFLRAAQKRKSN